MTRPVLLSLALAFSVAPVTAASPQDVVLPDGKAKAIVQQACADCHGLEQLVDNPMSDVQWRATVEKMVRKGASVSPDQIDLVVDYLSTYFAPRKINVNTATSQDLQNALKLTAAEADAIVQYRKANGNFKDLAGLGKVTSVDPKKIEAGKDLIEF
jgi:competence ComEA-like helix-hairpin-helix protein